MKKGESLAGSPFSSIDLLPEYSFEGVNFEGVNHCAVVPRNDSRKNSNVFS
jgi:hypothetical protein